MPAICMYFEVHQPFRLNRFSVFNIGENFNPFEVYFNHKLNKVLFERAVRKCYLPTNKLILELIEDTDRNFKVSFSLTGTFMEYCDALAQEVMRSFQDLVETGCVSLICETYYHSLSSLFEDLSEFKEQVEMHRNAIRSRFGYEPKVFRNTEAIYDNRIAKEIERMGFKGIITEGTEKILGWRSPNYIYRPVNAPNLKVLLRNHRLSDDIAFRFSAVGWEEYPLTADKYARWLSSCEGEIVNIFMDYETFGEHNWPESGIFDFLYHLPREVLKYPNNYFVTVDEAVERFSPVGEIDVPFAISWADNERDVSPWLGNEMQIACFNELKEIGKMLKDKGDEDLLKLWRLLQTSDHLYYISTKGFADGEIHKYFSPYSNPYEGFINYMNILQDLRRKVEGGRL
ncbi:MAG: glycoside hydrolase family 57 protein [Thermoplasmata archaeon]|nr:glycoside hydrolase family 57 protein [Thermoplasmata archaeon]